MNEIVRRVDPNKRTVGEIIRDEIAVPLQAEFYVGLPAEKLNLVSEMTFFNIIWDVL